MTWVAGAILVVIAVVLFFAFLPLLISVAAALLFAGFFYLLIRQILAWQLRRRALEVNATAQASPADYQPLWPAFAGMAVTLAASMVGLLVLFWLPDSLQADSLLAMGGSLVAATWGAVAVWLLGQLITMWSNHRNGAPVNAQPMAVEWWLAVGSVGLLAFLTCLVLSPNDGGWRAWREQLKGFESTQLRIVLKESDTPSATQEQALLQLLQPMLERGSRLAVSRMKTRSGTTVTVGAVPARYRFVGNALEIRMAGRMPAPELQRQLAVLKVLQEGNFVDPMLLANAQCQPSQQRMGRDQFLSQTRDLFQKLRACITMRQEQIRQVWPQLEGRIESVEVLPTVWFKPFFAGEGWTAVTLPTDEALEELDAVAQ